MKCIARKVGQKDMKFNKVFNIYISPYISFYEYLEGEVFLKIIPNAVLPFRYRFR